MRINFKIYNPIKFANFLGISGWHAYIKIVFAICYVFFVLPILPLNKKNRFTGFSSIHHYSHVLISNSAKEFVKSTAVNNMCRNELIVSNYILFLECVYLFIEDGFSLNEPHRSTIVPTKVPILVFQILVVDFI